MQDDISDLRLFSQLVEARGLSEAVRRHGSSVPAMSRRLTRMEQRLGVRLFQRSSRRFTLTDEGALLHQRALVILAAIDEAESEVSSKDGQVRGLLRVGAPMQIGSAVVAPLVGRFAALHPRVELRFMLADAALDVVDDGLDVAIRIGLPDDPATVARRLMSSRHAVCATPQYLATHGAVEKPDDLLQHNCLRLMRGQRQFDRWLFQEQGRQRHVQVGGSLTTSSGEVLHKWILQGLGIGFKAMWNVAEDLASGRLVECLPAYACSEVALYATFQKQAFLPLRVRAFVDFLAAEMTAG